MHLPFTETTLQSLLVWDFFLFCHFYWLLFLRKHLKCFLKYDQIYYVLENMQLKIIKDNCKNVLKQVTSSTDKN